MHIIDHKLVTVNSRNLIPSLFATTNEDTLVPGYKLADQGSVLH